MKHPKYCSWFSLCGLSYPNNVWVLTLLTYVARPYSTPRERVWDMAIEQFVAPHHGVRTNHITVDYSVT